MPETKTPHGNMPIMLGSLALGVLVTSLAFFGATFHVLNNATASQPTAISRVSTNRPNNIPVASADCTPSEFDEESGNPEDGCPQPQPEKFLDGDRHAEKTKQEKEKKSKEIRRAKEKDYHLPEDATFTTLVRTSTELEGLTGDSDGNLYSASRPATGPCVVWRFNLENPTPVVVGTIPAPICVQNAGITFDSSGDLYAANGGTGIVYKFTPDADAPSTATVFATGLPGANGLAFDQSGNLWVSDGTTNLGRVWKVAACSSLPCPAVEVFRVQPVRNSTSLGGIIGGTIGANGGVGRQLRNFGPATLTNTAGGQDLVANGLAFTKSGDLYIADTARGAIWLAQFDRQGNLLSETGCDTTFTTNTLCLSNIAFQHAYLEGIDGIALDEAGNIWAVANSRNAVVAVTKKGQVVEIFRNPVNEAGLRNSAPAGYGDNHILEFPASPFLLGKKLCIAQTNFNNRDNNPNPAGELSPTGAFKGKISCMDQDLTIKGMPLP